MADLRNAIGANFPRHGGDIASACRLYGVPEADWLDLSTGINPAHFPVPVLTAADFSRLPDPGRLADLLETARRIYGVPDGVGLIALPGIETGIRLLSAIVGNGRAAIVSPTYRTHAEAWRAAGHDVIEVRSVEAVPDDAAFAVVVNPNNPDGRLFDPVAIAPLSLQLGDRAGFVVVDESFADLAPEVSLIPHLTKLPAVVFRSLGKFYGLAGLRLGFAAGPDPVLDRVSRLAGDWPVSGPAIAVGMAAMADEAWRAETQARLKLAADRLHEILDRHGLETIGGTDLFILVADDAAPAIHEALARRGIWTRVFDYNPGWLRIGLPPPDGFERLDRALNEVL